MSRKCVTWTNKSFIQLNCLELSYASKIVGGGGAFFFNNRETQTYVYRLIDNIAEKMLMQFMKSSVEMFCEMCEINI